MRISIIGTGFVGLVTGACLAEKGHEVVCVDSVGQRVRQINEGKSPVFEAGLDDLLNKHLAGRLSVTTEFDRAVAESELTLISVGTPFDGVRIDLSSVMQVARQIGNILKEKSAYHVVVVKSTVIPGTTDSRVVPVLEEASGKRAGEDFGAGMNPEFLSEGQAVMDFLEPDRIVLGGIDDRSRGVLEELYRPFSEDIPRLKTNTRTAEMIKYVSNALLANLISFSNEMANLGSRLGGIDMIEVFEGVHASQYFKAEAPGTLPPITGFLRAGCGFGGSCLPKDVKALIACGRDSGEPMDLCNSVIQINEQQSGRVVELLHKHWADLKGVKIAVLGLAFKPGTNDVRESPALKLVRSLESLGANLRLHDPVASDEARKELLEFAGRIEYLENLNATFDDVEAVVVVTPWEEYQTLPSLIREWNPQIVLVDCRRAFRKDCVPRYEGIGL